MCRKYHVAATMPYFLPLPFPPFGTFGAVIKMKGLIPDKKALFDIGAAGQLMGLFFAIPAIIIGLNLSDVRPVPTDASQYLGLGEPILFSFISKLVFGHLPEGMDIYLHPLPLQAGQDYLLRRLIYYPSDNWTADTLCMHVGQKKRYCVSHRYLYFCIIAPIFCIQAGWFCHTAPALGFRHPSPTDEFTTLDRKRKILGVILFIIFLISFTPVPLRF